jgi:ribosome-associated toxin RatA of RatAB toxin-antitoxin module
MLFRSLVSFSPVTKRHCEQRVLANIPPHHLFRIIQNVDRYSEFLPLCSHSKILSFQQQQQQQKNISAFLATLTVGFVFPLSETYISQVTVLHDQLTIHTKSVESKWLDSLQSTWKLRAVNNVNAESPLLNNNSSNNVQQQQQHQQQHCHVDFSVTITASDLLIVQTLDQVLEHVAGRQVDAFETRCRQIPILKEDT